MLTPTGVTSSAYWDAIKAGNPTHVRLSFENQGIVLDDSDIDINTGLTVTDMFNGDTDLVFGRAVSKEVSTSILNTGKLNGLIWTGEFKLEMGVEINGSTNWVTIGYFSGEKPNNITSVNTIAFTAYDRMTLFDMLCDEYVSSITYPATLKNIYDGLCAFVGVQNVAGDELPNIMNRTFAAAPVDIAGYTCRDILKWIAEACGCYATINEAGKVQMVWFTDNTGHIITGDEEYNVESADVNDGMTWDEADTYTWDEFDQFTWNDVCGYEEAYAIDRMILKQLESDMDICYPEGITGGNTYLIANNPFMSIGSGTDLNNYVVPLFNRLSMFGGYLPVKLACVGNWCVEAGDMVTVEVQGHTLTVPIFVKTMNWNGAINDDYDTTGNKIREVYMDTAQKQQILNSREIKLFVEGNYYGIKSGVEITDVGVIITGGKSVRIESGGTFDVDSTNFTISSEDKRMTCGNWKFDDGGIYYKRPADNFGFEIAENSERDSNASGIYYREIAEDWGYAGQINMWMVDKDLNGNIAQGVFQFGIQHRQGMNPLKYFIPSSAGMESYIGANGAEFSFSYINHMYCQTIGSSSSHATTAYIDSVYGNLYGGVWMRSVSLSDANDLTINGDFWIPDASVVAHLPATVIAAGGGVYCHVSTWNANLSYQYIFTQSAMFVRMKINGTWHAWYIHQGTQTT
jgi:hypothetical protein